MKKCQLFSIPTDMLRYVRVSLYACRICIVLTPTVLKTSACYVAIFVTPAFCTPYLARTFCREFRTLSLSLSLSRSNVLPRISISLFLTLSLSLSQSNVLTRISISRTFSLQCVAANFTLSPHKSHFNFTLTFALFHMGLGLVKINFCRSKF